MEEKNQKKTILIIDDDKEHLELMLHRFQSNPNLKVESAHTGKEGLSIAQNLHPDLIILDLLLPVMSGFKVLQSLKQDESLKHIPVIVISAIYEPEDVSSCMRIGADRFYEKTQIFMPHSKANHEPFFEAASNLLGLTTVVALNEKHKKIFLVGQDLKLEAWLTSKGYDVKKSSPVSSLEKINYFVPGAVIFRMDGVDKFNTWIKRYSHTKHPIPVIVIGDQKFQKEKKPDKKIIENFFIEPLDFNVFEQFLKEFFLINKLRISQGLLRKSMIKEVKTLETALNELQKLDQYKSDFISIAAHELRTPLSIIMSSLELIHSLMQPDPKIDRFFNIILDNIKRMNNIITTYLNVKKIDTFEMKLKKEPVFISNLLEEVIRTYSILARQKNIEIQFDGSKKLPPLEVDPNRCKDIFGQILDNAIKFSPPHKSITIHAEDQENDIVIEIKDFGPGIPKKYLKKIFEKFKIAADPLTRTTNGNGLGLYIASKLAELHGGGIKLSSELGKGSCFTVILPKSKK